jgi:hypothetical protein
MLITQGLVCIWSGAVADIPKGWQLCDGTNGKPDLRDKFILGAGNTYAPEAIGGAATHTHDFITNGHNHSYTTNMTIAAGSTATRNPLPNTDSGTTDAMSHLPPYYALCFVIKC